MRRSPQRLMMLHYFTLGAEFQHPDYSLAGSGKRGFGFEYAQQVVGQLQDTFKRRARHMAVFIRGDLTSERYGEAMVEGVMPYIRQRPAGAMVGAMFLKEFVGDAPWVHLDMAGTAWSEKGTALPIEGFYGRSCEDTSQPSPVDGTFIACLPHTISG